MKESIGSFFSSLFMCTSRECFVPFLKVHIVEAGELMPFIEA